MIYTLGYADWTIENVIEEVRNRNAILVDVRQSPQTSKPGFSRAELKERLENRYRHVSAFGNVNYKGGPVELANPERGVEIVLGFEHDPVLMCGCKSLEKCHRTMVANLLHERSGSEIKHLQAPGQREQPGLFDD